jgi:hypothetical protein
VTVVQYCSWNDMYWSCVPSVRHTVYWFSSAVKQNICLQRTQSEVPQPTDQHHFTELSNVHYIKHFETYFL